MEYRLDVCRTQLQEYANEFDEFYGYDSPFASADIAEWALDNVPAIISTARYLLKAAEDYRKRILTAEQLLMLKQALWVNQCEETDDRDCEICPYSRGKDDCLCLDLDTVLESLGYDPYLFDFPPKEER